MTPSLLLVEDDEVFARAITRALGLRGYAVVHATNADTASHVINQTNFDFAILDLNLGGHTSLSLIQPLRSSNPKMRILMLTGYASIATAVEAIKLGADDYLVKPVDPDQLIAAVHARLQRAKNAGARNSRPLEQADPTQLESLGLTPREAEVLFWVAQGKTNPEIGIITAVKLTTVKKHLESVYQKLGVDNRTAAATMALESLGPEE